MKLPTYGSEEDSGRGENSDFELRSLETAHIHVVKAGIHVYPDVRCHFRQELGNDRKNFTAL